MPTWRRKLNPQLSQRRHNERCASCGRPPPCDIDHIRSIGAGGDNSEWNTWALCRWCHTEKHAYGLTRFVDSRPHLAILLVDKGWEFDGYKKKWIKK